MNEKSLRMGQIGCPETSASNYYSLRNNPEEHSSLVYKEIIPKFICKTSK